MNNTDPTWRVSTFSDNGTCVEVAVAPDGGALVRNSNAREAGTLAFTQAEMAAWIKGIKAGEFDDWT
ncbi:DUF397 domain-containing protein [Nocardia sp. CA2R105]|jgi:hypothetical protein|uniref:DUF397 domain-containing protein n=1 Tax=Nocardia jiangxiensis TaxID=282685 RepID=A0ABW6SG59_9NOCA|nr:MULTISPECIES: DUF397 domain-containing protein [Nocardia]MBY8863483.1 DUF397 domain-containing protein [Nocardia coffeae]